MTTVLVAIGVLAVAFVFMGWALHFAQYKKKQQSCCTDALEAYGVLPPDHSSCFTCPRREEEGHQCEREQAMAPEAEAVGKG